MITIILAAGSGQRFRDAQIETPKPLVRLGGLSLVERTARTARKAGASEIVIVLGSRASYIQQALEHPMRDLPVRWVVNDQWESGNGTSVLAAAPWVGTGPFMILMADHLVFPQTLRRVWEASRSGGCVMGIDLKKSGLSDPDDATKVCVSGDRITAIGKTLQTYDGYDTGISVCTNELLSELRQAAAAQQGRCAHTDGMRRLVESGRLRACEIGADRWEDVDSPVSYQAAERLLMMSLRKSTDGFMSRTLERRLSGRVTRLLMNSPVTPNQVTLAIIVIGAAAAALFAQVSLRARVAGALLFWCASFLDGCDGELARLKFKESRLGGWLDLWADNLVHAMVFTGMGLGLWRETSNPQWIVLGAVAALGVLMSVGWVSWTTLRRKRGDGPFFTSVVGSETRPTSPWAARLTRLADTLSRRDFIFGVIFITLLNGLPYFLWAAAIGSHVYWVILVSIALAGRVSNKSRVTPA